MEVFLTWRTLGEFDVINGNDIALCISREDNLNDEWECLEGTNVKLCSLPKIWTVCRLRKHSNVLCLFCFKKNLKYCAFVTKSIVPDCHLTRRTWWEIQARLEQCCIAYYILSILYIQIVTCKINRQPLFLVLYIWNNKMHGELSKL